MKRKINVKKLKRNNMVMDKMIVFALLGLGMIAIKKKIRKTISICA